MKEIWKVAYNTNGLYLVSNKGNVKRSEGFVKNNKNGGVRKVGGKNLKPKTKSNGYLEVNLSFGGGLSKSFYVHILVASSFIKRIPEGYTVNHKNGIKSDNRLDNLEIITYSENMRHSYDVLGRKRSFPKGEGSHFSKLKSEDVKKILDVISKGELTQKEVGNMFNISQSHVSRLKLKRSWSHLCV